MAKKNKVSMPSGIGGLVQYHDEASSRFQIQPGQVVIIALLVIVVMIALHLYGGRFLGL